MNYSCFITSSTSVMLVKPVVKNTRISVALILQKMSEGASIIDLIMAYPDLTEESIHAALAYAADVIENEALIND